MSIWGSQSKYFCTRDTEAMYGENCSRWMDSYIVRYEDGSIQSNEVERIVYLKLPEESNGSWRIVYELEKTVKAWNRGMVALIYELGEIKSRLDSTIFSKKMLEKNWKKLCLCTNNFFYQGRIDFEGDVLKKLKEKLEVQWEETWNFKYISVRIRQEWDRVVMSPRHYSRVLERNQDGDSKGKGNWI